MEWVKCSERLPEIEQRVLIYAVDMYPRRLVWITGAERSGDNADWSWLGEGDYESWKANEITHWMPLPEPPVEIT